MLSRAEAILASLRGLGYYFSAMNWVVDPGSLAPLGLTKYDRVIRVRKF